jgi:hypothetical protein
MRCEEVQEYLAERLAGSLSDRLSETLQSHVRTHMRSCTECCEELEDFEEMQTVLRSIPIEACDTDSMRARFNLLIGAKEKEEAAHAGPALRSWTMPRPGKSVLAVFAGLVVLSAAVFAVKQVMKRDDVSNTVVPIPEQTSKPAVVEVRTGSMSGQVKTAKGEARRKVRVAVIAVPNSGLPSTEIAVESGADGRFRLENIPAGRYYVLATSIDSPTYYPGTPDVSGAKVVTVQAGAVLEGIDFTRVEPADVSGENQASASQMVAVDVTIRHESGERLPFKPDASIVFTATSGDFQIAASHFVGNLFRVSLPANNSYTVAVSGTAAGYTIQSIVDGRNTDLLHGGFFKANPGKSARARIFVTLSKN